jgi:hypothetical protein
MKPSSPLIFVLAWFQAAAQGAVTVTVADPSGKWKPLAGNYDFQADQQTGQGQPSSSDIVGLGTNYGFLTAFNDNGSFSNTDGTMGFRVRLDDHDGNNAPEFKNVVWIGIDANQSGSIDVFVAADLQGNPKRIAIFAPGTGANDGPGTTTIGSVVTSYALDPFEDETPANYNYRAVDFNADGGDTDDVTSATSGDIDYYVSFMVPFADVVSYLGGLAAPIHITDSSPLRYVMATSTQNNIINQDFGGVEGSGDSNQTWAELGGLSNAAPVPEPSSGLLVLGSLAAGLLVRKRV